MNYQEQNQLSIVRDEVLPNLPNKTTLKGLVSGCSSQLVSEIKQLLPNLEIDPKPKRGNLYDLIIKNFTRTLSFADIQKLSALLNGNSCLVIFADNPKKSTSLKSGMYTLDKSSDHRLVSQSLETVFREPYGKFQQFNGFKSSRFSELNNLIKKLPNSKLYSPFIAVVLRLNHRAIYKKYYERTSFFYRLVRISHRSSLTRFLANLVKRIWLSHQSRDSYQAALESIPVIDNQHRKPILICMTYLNMGGVERVMLNIIKNLDRKKFAIHVMTTVKSHNPWLPQFQKFADNIIILPEIISPRQPNRHRSEYIFRYVIKNNISVLFITNSEAAYYATKKIKKHLKSEVKIYDLLHTHGTPKDRDAYLRISMPFDRFIDKRIVISKYLKKYYVDHYPINPEKIRVIHNSIDYENTKIGTRRSADLIFNRIPKKHKVIIYVGRLDVDKSPMRLVDIARQLKQREIPASILIVGNGSEYIRMKETAKLNGALNKFVFFYGQSNLPGNLMRHSDFTINVSNAEGISMSILESMSLGVPVIASKVGGTPEIIDHKKDGVLVDINSAKTESEKIDLFVSAITWAIKIDDQQKLRMGKSAKRKIKSRFSCTHKKYEKLFLEQ